MIVCYWNDVGLGGWRLSVGEFKPSTDVLTRFAEAFSENGSVKKTRLHFASRINWHSFQRYLDWLTEKNYVKHKIEGKYISYHTTELGKEVFRTLLKLKGAMLVIPLLFINLSFLSSISYYLFYSV